MPATLTPEQTFGFGSVPLASYFKAPKGGSRNTQFSPQARAMLAEDEAYQQNSRQQEADQLVNELLNNAPGMSDEEINYQLVQNPNIFRGRDAGLIQNYQNFRQQAATPADQKLGTYFYTKIQEDKDPRHLQNFQRRMLNEGMSANDAWEAYRTDQFNEPLMQQLAEAGVPREQFDMYRTQSGAFDPVEVSRGIAQVKALKEASSGRGKPLDPLDDQIKTFTQAMDDRRKHIEAIGGDITKDTVYDSYVKRLEGAYKKKDELWNPPPAKPKIESIVEESAGSPDEVATQSEAPPAFDVTVSPEENQARLEKHKQQAGEREVANKIARVWTDKKLALTDKIAASYKSPEEILAVAHAIDANGPITHGGKTEPYLSFIADKLGIKSSDTAFDEPDNVRWGTQKVTNRELLKEWAASILKVYKAQKKEGEGSTGQPAQTGNIQAIQPVE